MSYPGGKQQAPLIQQGGNYPQIYTPQVYPYDKSDVGGGLPDGRGPALNQQGRYQPHQQGRMYPGPHQPGDLAASSAAVAYQQQQLPQQQPQPLMRPPASGMGYGQRGGGQAQMGAGPRPQAPYGQHMNMPPPPGAPPFLGPGPAPQTQPHQNFVFVLPGNRPVMPSSNMTNSFMPVPYPMPQYQMQAQQQAPHGYQQPMWQAQPMHYSMQQQQRPVQPMQPQSAPGPPAPAPQRSKRIAIIHPDTGKEVSPSSREEAAPKEDRKEDTAQSALSTSCAAEFAKKVAQVASEGARHSRAASISDARSRTTSETAPAAAVTPVSAVPPPAAEVEAHVPVPVAAAPAPAQVNGAVSPPEATPAPAPPTQTAAAPLSSDTVKEVSAAPNREQTPPKEESPAQPALSTSGAAELAKAQAAPEGPRHSRAPSDSRTPPAQTPPPTPAVEQPAPTQPQTQHEDEGRQQQQHSQKKTKSKQKMRELNRRAEGKEGGGDMDAFVDAKPSAAAAAPATKQPAAKPTPPAAAAKPPVAAAAAQKPPAAATPAAQPAPAAASAQKPSGMAAAEPAAPAATAKTPASETAAPKKPEAPESATKSTAAAPAKETEPAADSASVKEAPPAKPVPETPVVQSSKVPAAKPVQEVAAKTSPPPAKPEPEPAAPAPAPAAKEEQAASPAPEPEADAAAKVAASAPAVVSSATADAAEPAPAPAPAAEEKPEADAAEPEVPPPAEPAPVAVSAAAAEADPTAPAKTADETLEEGEIRDEEPPTVNGEAEQPGAKSPWQLELERMKAESISIGQKMSYNRDDLMKLQDHPLSQKRPDRLPDLPSIVRKDRSPGDARAFAAIKSRSMGPTTGMPDCGPGVKPLPPKGYRGGRGSQQGRREMQGGGPPGGGPRTIQISLNRDVKLKTTENAWKPGGSKEGEGDDEEKVIRQLKGILNKLTPNNIDKMTVEIKKLELNTESRLHKMITTLFDKAVDEPMYADMYATLCVTMGRTEVKTEVKVEGKADGEVTEVKSVNFRKLLLTQCQTEFEKDKTGELNREERLAEISKITDEQTKREKKHLLDQEARRMRMRSNGNIRFIGELYKLGMLTDKIMHQCIVKLVRDKHDDSYECMCKLMTTIGEKLENAEKKHGKNLDPMFADFAKLPKDMSLPSRIRFMLQDLIDMRNNNWVNTRTVGQAKPMTIDEVHKQAALQQAQAQSAVAVQLEDRRRNAPDRRGGGGRGGRGSQGGASSDGWNTVNRRYDPGRVMNAISSGASQLESMKLGPGGGGGPGSAWSFGSKRSGGRGPPTAQPVSNEVRPSTNIFTMLSDDEASGQMPPMRLAPGGGRGRTQPTRGSQEHAARQTSRPAPPAGPQLSGPATMDEEKIKGKVRMICDEYVSANDFAASIQDVEQHLHADTVAAFVRESLLMYVDARTTKQRHLVGELHRRLIESRHFKSDTYLKGVTEMLAFAVDLAPDIPSMWANLAEMLAPPVSAGKSVTLAALAAPAAPLIEDMCGPKFVVALLKRLASLHGSDKVRAIVPANFNWTVYFGSTDHVEPLVNAQLGFLIAGANVPLSDAEAPESRGVRSLLSPVQQEDNLEMWLKRNISEKNRGSSEFIKDLVCALCFDAIVIDNGAKKAQLSRLEKHTALLKCLIVNADLELSALYGVTALIRHLQFPPGVLDQIFRQLYDDDVISEPAFQRWREGTNSAEQEGMGVALMSVKAFFQALEEAAAAGDDDEPRT